MTSSPSLTRRASSGVAWNVGQTLVSRAASAATFVVLARLLSPTDFGLVSLAAVFVALMQVFVDQGFAQALVQRAKVDPAHLDSAFWTSIAIGTVLTAVAVGLAHPIADLLGQRKVAPLLQGMSSVLLLAALSSTPAALLQRDLQFRSLALRNVTGNIGGAVAGVALAYAGFGAWSLVGQAITQAGLGTVVLWTAVTWRPGFRVSGRHVRDLGSFASNVVVMNFMNFLNRRADDLLIGAVLGARALGIYSVAYRLLILLTDILSRTMDAVAFPLFSKVQLDVSRIKRGYLSGSQLCSAIATPTFLALAALAPEIVSALFGDRWAAAAPVMRILSFIGILHANFAFNNAVLMALGKPRSALILTTINAVANVIAFVVAVHWGIQAVAAAYVIRGYLLSPLPILTVRALLRFDLTAILAQFAIPMLCSLVMAAVLLVLRATGAHHVGAGTFLVISAPLAAATYLASMILLAPRFSREVGTVLVEVAPFVRRLLPRSVAARLA